MYFILLFVLLQNQNSDAVIYKLNDSDYARMPPLMYMDNYETCQLDTDALYCTTELMLVSDKPSSLLDMIHEYSEDSVKHYNHTLLRHGICITQTCKKYYKKQGGDLQLTLEACLNESFVREYDLSVKVLDNYYCKPPGSSETNIDNVDYIVGIICVVILMCNVVGTLCDGYFKIDEDKRVNRILLCFSMYRNWNKLLAPDDEYYNYPQLRGLHGLRVLTTIIVNIGHTSLSIFFLIDNPKILEELYYYKSITWVLYAVWVVQTFFIITIFLLVYKKFLNSKEEVTWSKVPKYYFDRWMRLTPAYALVLALSATWYSRLSSGPMWDKYMGKERNDCRNYWWRHILYINNYFNDSNCMTHVWYLSAELQLYYLAVIIYIACRTTRSRTIVLSVFTIAGLLASAAHVYLQDIDGILLISPESVLKLFVSTPHFGTIYVNSHTNLQYCMIGMALGYLVYYCEKHVDMKKYQTLKYRLVYWSLIPMILLSWHACNVFYDDGPKSVYYRIFSAILLKPIYSLLSAGVIFGLIFKIEGTFRRMLEWKGLTTLSRLCYCSFLIHMTTFKHVISARSTTFHLGVASNLPICLFVVTVSFVLGAVLWILVETPFNNVSKEFFSKRKNKTIKQN